jgi:hypothetical protein
MTLLLYGATGVTGQRCVDALETAGVDYLVGGRNRATLEAAAGPHCQGIRVASADAIGSAFDGVGCVLSTVGPFARFGLPVLDAAIAAGAHYVDTTAEQSFLRQALTRDHAARTAGVTASPACGVEYLPMFLLAELLGEGPVESFLWLDDFLPTQGSVRSMVAMAGVGPTPWPRSVRFGDRSGSALRIPGAEEVLIHPDCKTFLVLRWFEAWPFALSWLPARLLGLGRFGDATAAKLTDPTPEQQAAAGFTVIVRQGDRTLRLDGEDVYGSTALYATTVARLLDEGHALKPGVLPAGKALDPKEILQAAGSDIASCE